MEHVHSTPPRTTAIQPLFLGLDLSTQQLKVIVLEQQSNNCIVNQNDDGLRTHSSFAIHFDSELPQYHTRGGVHAHAQQGNGVVTAPVLMWVEALERVFEKMKVAQFPFHRVVSISGAAQQHGSVYWSSGATQAFEALRGSPPGSCSSSTLAEIFKDAFTVAQSPIWQDTSTTRQCEEMEVFLGKLESKRRGPSGTTITAGSTATAEESVVRLLGQQRLADLTGSRAYERYTGSQILKIVQESPEVYQSTTRISLVSSFLASVLIASYASIDVADGSGMNLLDIRTKTWDPSLTQFIDKGGRVDCESTEQIGVANSLVEKLGEIDASGEKVQGVLSSWFVSHYGFSPDVKIVTFTGDNPATAMALRAEHGDAMVSLGTSDTLLLYTDTHAWSIKHDGNSPATNTDKGKQDGGASAAAAAARLSVGYLCHPVDPEGLLMLYCAKNGSLAREQVRDLYADSNWDRFDQYLREGMMGDSDGNEKSVGFYFFDREIWPPVQGVYRFESGVAVDEFGGSADDTAKRVANVVAICESQFLAMRIRSSQGETSSTSSLSLNPPGISRILATGGASSNRVLLQLLANVFGVPVVSMGTADQQPGAGSAAWGAARKAYLYGRQDATDDTGIGRNDDNDRDSGRRDNNESAVAIMPDLEQTKKYADHIPEFLRLEASLL